MIAFLRSAFLAASLGGLATAAPAQEVEPPPREVPLWPAGSQVLLAGIDALAGEAWAVTHPSLLVYPPRAPSTRSAVLVFPGGGFKALAIGPDSTIGRDGADVCRWLTDAGITCILVKYRVPNTACNWNRVTRRHDAPAIPMALQDTQRALSIVRYHAGDYGIDPDRIGVLGFSAGGHLAVLASTTFGTRAYAPIDAIDRVSPRPDFAIPVYPGHMTMEHKNHAPKALAAQQLNTDIVVSPTVPPTLLIHARDDDVDPVHYSLVYERELEKAGVDVELMLYDTGGHAFGVRRQGKDTDRWTDDALRWLQRIGMRPAPTVAASPGGPGRTARAATTRFHFDDIPVRSALQLLAEEGGFNLVVSDSVQGNITLHLEDVTWEQVLDIVLRMKGLEQHVDGGSRSVTAVGG